MPDARLKWTTNHVLTILAALRTAKAVWGSWLEGDEMPEKAKKEGETMLLVADELQEELRPLVQHLPEGKIV